MFITTHIQKKNFDILESTVKNFGKNRYIFVGTDWRESILEIEKKKKLVLLFEDDEIPPLELVPYF